MPVFVVFTKVDNIKGTIADDLTEDDESMDWTTALEIAASRVNAEFQRSCQRPLEEEPYQGHWDLAMRVSALRGKSRYYASITVQRN